MQGVRGPKAVRDVRPVEVPGQERQHDPDGGDGGRGSAHLPHFAEVGLEPDLEEQDEDAELGEHGHDLGHRTGRRNQAQRARAEEDAGEELAQDGRLAHPLGQLAEELGRDQDAGEHEEDVRHFMAAALRRQDHLQAFHGAGMEAEGVTEQRQVHFLGVLALDGDLAAAARSA